MPTFLAAYALVCAALALGYAALLFGVLRVWRALPTLSAPPAFHPSVRISVVIAARNEAAYIESCLQSILRTYYPVALREVIVVDDYSEDDTAVRVARLAAKMPGTLQLLRLSEANPPAPPGKKSALQYGIAHATGELIVTTDADCIAPPQWLRLLAWAYETHRPGAIAAPVLLEARAGAWAAFQALDVGATMAITAAALARGWFAAGNGANLCYPKATFEAVGAFAGSEHRASGDDMFLLAKLPVRRVLFLKNADAAVHTQPCPTARDFFWQRLRWGTKNTQWPNRRLQFSLALSLALCLTILVNAALALVCPLLGWVALFQCTAKVAADYALLRHVTAFFRQKALLRYFWPAAAAHLVYVATVGLASLFVLRCMWKGRWVK